MILFITQLTVSLISAYRLIHHRVLLSPPLPLIGILLHKQVQMVLQVQPDLLDPQGRQVAMVQTAQTEQPDLAVQRDQQVLLDLPVVMVQTEQQVHREQQDQRDQRDQQVRQALLVLRVHKVHKV